MKLRTEMLELGGEMRLATFVGCGDNRDPATAKEHDAMAAHALLQAIEAWGKHPGYQGGESWVKHRAAEILAGWLGEEVAK